MTKGFQITTFRDQGDNSSVEVHGHPTGCKDLPHFISN